MNLKSDQFPWRFTELWSSLFYIYIHAFSNAVPTLSDVLVYVVQLLIYPLLATSNHTANINKCIDLQNEKINTFYLVHDRYEALTKYITNTPPPQKKKKAEPPPLPLFNIFVHNES